MGLLDDDLEKTIEPIELIRCKMRKFIWGHYHLHINPYQDVYQRYDVKILDIWALETAYWNEGSLDDIGFFIETDHTCKCFLVYLRSTYKCISTLVKNLYTDEIVTLKMVLEEQY